MTAQSIGAAVECLVLCQPRRCRAKRDVDARNVSDEEPQGSGSTATFHCSRRMWRAGGQELVECSRLRFGRFCDLVRVENFPAIPALWDIRLDAPCTVTTPNTVMLSPLPVGPPLNSASGNITLCKLHCNALTRINVKNGSINAGIRNFKSRQVEGRVALRCIISIIDKKNNR